MAPARPVRPEVQSRATHLVRQMEEWPFGNKAFGKGFVSCTGHVFFVCVAVVRLVMGQNSLVLTLFRSEWHLPECHSFLPFCCPSIGSWFHP